MPVEIEGSAVVLMQADCRSVLPVVEGRLRFLAERGGGDPGEIRVLKVIMRCAALGLIDDVIADQSAVPRQSSVVGSGLRCLSSRAIGSGAAARRLGLGQAGRRVRQLLEEGVLKGELVNGRWQIDAGSVEAEARRRGL